MDPELCQRGTPNEGPARGVKDMKIATKLLLFFCAVVTLFVTLAVVLLGQARSVSAGYEALLSKPVREMDMARVIQVNFKKQVQEWKDILLRGTNTEDLTKYTRQFQVKEAEVRSGAQALSDVVEDAKTKELLKEFINAHEAMTEKYRAAYIAYLTGNYDFKSADSMVRGQDRKPTDLFDEVVRRIDEQVKGAVEAQNNAVRRSRSLTLGVFAGLLLGLGLLGLVTMRSVLRRLEKLNEVAERLACAEIDGLTIDISGKDEIGRFGESMKGVHAAIEELMAASSSVVH